MTARASRKSRGDDPLQEELPLSSLSSHALFPGRTVLYIAEVAKALDCDEKHVRNLIQEFEETGGASGLKGFSIARGWQPGLPSPRAAWRVAVSDFDAFVAKRRDSHTTA